MAERIKSYRQLHVYQNAIDVAMAVFQVTRTLPPEERFSMVDQVRRSSRSVCTNIAEAWRKRRYRGAFISKLNDAEAEACETQVWMELALRCHYVNAQCREDLDERCEVVMGQLVKMIQEADKWLIK